MWPVFAKLLGVDKKIDQLEGALTHWSKDNLVVKAEVAEGEQIVSSDPIAFIPGTAKVMKINPPEYVTYLNHQYDSGDYVPLVRVAPNQYIFGTVRNTASGQTGTWYTKLFSLTIDPSTGAITVKNASDMTGVSLNFKYSFAIGDSGIALYSGYYKSGSTTTYRAYAAYLNASGVPTTTFTDMTEMTQLPRIGCFVGATESAETIYGICQPINSSNLRKYRLVKSTRVLSSVGSDVAPGTSVVDFVELSGNRIALLGRSTPNAHVRIVSNVASTSAMSLGTLVSIDTSFSGDLLGIFRVGTTDRVVAVSVAAGASPRAYLVDCSSNTPVLVGSALVLDSGASQDKSAQSNSNVQGDGTPSDEVSFLINTTERMIVTLKIQGNTLSLVSKNPFVGDVYHNFVSTPHGYIAFGRKSWGAGAVYSNKKVNAEDRRLDGIAAGSGGAGERINVILDGVFEHPPGGLHAGQGVSTATLAPTSVNNEPFGIALNDRLVKITAPKYDR